MDGKMLLGREIAVVFAEKNRKKPTDMRAREKKVTVVFPL
jgi:FUS-interacting serine-arginine-rich protein 1